MDSDFIPIYRYGTADTLDIVNGYLEALEHFNTPQSDVGYNFFIQQLPFNTLTLESVNAYYKLIDTYEVCSEFKIYNNFDEIQKAIDAGVTFITDNLYDRTRPYNIGERQVAAFLKKHGYFDNDSGIWKK